MPRSTAFVAAVAVFVAVSLAAAASGSASTQLQDDNQTVQLTAVVDRFEGEMAVIMLRKQQAQLDFPQEMLPDAADEGTVLRIQITADLLRTEQIRKQQQKRLKRLQRISQ